MTATIIEYDFRKPAKPDNDELLATVTKLRKMLALYQAQLTSLNDTLVMINSARLYQNVLNAHYEMIIDRIGKGDGNETV